MPRLMCLLSPCLSAGPGSTGTGGASTDRVPASYHRHVQVPSAASITGSSIPSSAGQSIKTRLHLPPASYEKNTYTLLKLYNLDERVLGSVLKGLTDEQVIADCPAHTCICWEFDAEGPMLVNTLLTSVNLQSCDFDETLRKHCQSCLCSLPQHFWALHVEAWRVRLVPSFAQPQEIGSHWKSRRPCRKSTQMW